MATATSIRLPDEIDHRLDELARITHRTKSFYIRQAIERHLEDLEDLYIAVERVNRPDRKLLSTEEVKNELGI